MTLLRGCSTDGDKDNTMHQRVGTCSICGGDVVRYHASFPPYSPDRCLGCGAVPKGDVIEMVPVPLAPPHSNTGTTPGFDWATVAFYP